MCNKLSTRENFSHPPHKIHRVNLRNNVKIQTPNSKIITEDVIRKPRTKKGVHCSIIRCTKTESERNINTKSYKNTTNFEWRRSTHSDLKKFTPLYAANNLTTALLRKKKQGSKRKGKKNAIPNNYEEDESEEKLALGNIIKERQKALPLNNGYYNNSHNFVNRERVKRNALPLYRVRQLDELASEQAKIMAAQQSREHSNLDTLMSNLTKQGPCRKVGENVCRGTSIPFIHKKMMLGPKYAADKNNILDRRYSSFGIGVAPCVDGIFYVCQIYKG